MVCMSKYEKDIFALLSKEELKSTNEILKDLERKTKKVINWHALYRILMELTVVGKVQRTKTKAGFFWRKN